MQTSSMSGLRAKLYAALKLYEGGKRNEVLWRHIQDNVRTPTMNAGDIEAMMAACRLGQERFQALLGKYGPDLVMSAAEKWMDYSEQMLRREIAKVPDGRYIAPVQWLDDDARNRDVRLPVHCAVTVSGDDIVVDLTGSADQVETAFNVTFEGTLIPAVYYLMHCIFLDESRWGSRIPHNDGLFRPIRVEAPEGSIFKPRFPAACCARSQQPILALDSANLALNQIVPELTTAGNPAHVPFLAYSGYLKAQSEYWVYLEVNETCSGARYHKDGMDSIDFLLVNTRNNPIEDLEWRYPIRCEQYEVRDQVPAAGEWRGGVSVVRRNRFLVDGFVSSESDRQTDPPKGVYGGHNGATAAFVLNPGTANEKALPGKLTAFRCRKGDVIEVRSATGGGWGSPLDRDPWAVWRDVEDGYLTNANAAEYGVVLGLEGPNFAETAKARLKIGKVPVSPTHPG